MRHNGSIRTLLSLLVLSLGLPLLGLLIYAEYRLVSTDLRRAKDELLADTDAVAMGVEQFLANTRTILEGLAGDPALRSMDPERCPTYVDELGALFIPTYTNLYTANLEGEPVCSARPIPAGWDTMPPPPGWDERIAAQGFHVGAVHRGLLSDRWTVAISHPLRDDSGEQVGGVVLPVDLIRFQRILEDLIIPVEGVVTVLEEETQRVVARSREAGELVGQVAPDPRLDSPGDPDVESRGIAEAETFRGTEYVWGFTEVPRAGWLVFSGLPRELVYGPYRRHWARTTLLTLLVLGLAGLMGIRVYRRITRPLNHLVEGTAAASPGDPAPLRPEGPREIAQVAQRFNEAWEAWGRSEEARKRSHERIRSFVENAVMGICIVTEEGRFLEANQAMVDLLGYESRRELLATPFRVLYPSRHGVEEILAEFGTREAFRGVETQWTRKNGSPVRVRLFGRRIETSQGEAAWEIVVEDLSELLTLQEQYLQSQKMEALGRLAGGIAHDFNNLLTVVQGQAALLMEEPGLDEDLRLQLREILDAAERGAELNRQLLAFGRRTSTSKDTLELNTIIRGIQVMLQRAAGEEAQLQLQLHPELEGIYADRSQMEQIVMNLVVNARDAMPRGGTILLETYNAVVSPEDAQHYPESQPGPHAVLAVSDTGSGMDPETVRHIFEPFFSTKPETRGTGLGLATVYGIVMDAGGHIRVETEPDKGSTFRVFLPSRRTAETPEAAPPPARRAPPVSGVILLAEDQDAVRKLARTILERAGFRVLEARDGTEALQLAQQHDGPIHLLLSDVVMPGLRGPELAEELAREGLVDRAVLFSGYPEGMREAGPEGLAAWRFIPKPFSSSELLTAIQDTLGG